MLKTGDRVILKINIPPKDLFIGDSGTVVGREPGSGLTRVRWDLEGPRSGFHSCGGHCEEGFGWNVAQFNLALESKSLISEDFDISPDELLGLFEVAL